MKSLLAVLALFVFSAALSAQRLVVKAGRLLGVRNQKVIENQVLEIENGIIKRIGPEAATDSGQVIDLSKYTVLPGMIDCHTHLLKSNDLRNGFEDPNTILTLAQMNTAQRVLLGARNAAETLASGTSATPAGPVMSRCVMPFATVG